MPIALAQRLILRWNSHPLRREILFFGMVGVAGFLTNLAVFDGLRGFIGDIAARIIALAIATVVTWWFNRQHTFLSADKDWLRELGRYAFARLFTNGFEGVVSLSVLWLWPGLGTIFAIACGALSAMVINFLAAKFYAYKKIPN